MTETEVQSETAEQAPESPRSRSLTPKAATALRANRRPRMLKRRAREHSTDGPGEKMGIRSTGGNDFPGAQCGDARHLGALQKHNTALLRFRRHLSLAGKCETVSVEGCRVTTET